MSQLLAPWAPFVADEVWRKVAKGTNLPTSVHLSDWPEVGKTDQKALDDMQAVRDVITEGLAQRAAAKVKVRQPLAAVAVPKLPKAYEDILAEELNVKKVEFGAKEVKLDITMTDALKAEGAMRDLVRHVQNLRKTAGLSVDDRIVLQIESADTLVQRALADFGEVVKQETLAVEMTSEPQDNVAKAKVEGVEVTISLSKAK
jgi:isoleucyl-tRNA synthetase